MQRMLGTGLISLALLALACGDEATPPSASDAVPEAGVAVSDAADDDDDGALAALQAEASAKYLAQDYKAYIELQKQLVEKDTDGGVARYNLACGYALSGQGDKAIAELRTLLEAGQDFGAAQDPDFSSIRDTPEFQALLADVAARFPTVSTSTEVVALDDWQLVPEGMAWDAAHGRYFLSSIAKAKVVTVTPDGQEADFAKVDADGIPLAVLGLEVDPKRNMLWAVGNAFSQVEGFLPEHAGTTGIFGFDLDTGERKVVHMRPAGEGKSGFNDLTVAPDGTIYASGEDVLTRISPDGTLARVAVEPEAKFSNGITFGPDAGTLYLATQDGILRVDPATGKGKALGAPDGEQIGSFDGMYWHEGALAGVQLGGRWRVAELTLDASGDNVVAVRTLEQANPTLSSATTGAIVGDDLHYIARRRPTGAVLESVPEAQRGLANLPVIMKAPLAPTEAVTSGD